MTKMTNKYNAKCNVCGGDNIVDLCNTSGIICCEYCDSNITLPQANSTSETIDLLRQGNTFLYTCEFDKAYDVFKRAVQKSNNEPEAYFGMALAEFKVQYLYDEVNKHDQPICYDISEKLFRNDKHYKKAVGLATEAQRSEYERRCNEIDAVRKEFYRLKKSGEEYDCFICCKVTDGAGGTTADAHQATLLHKHLTGKGYKPFYSEFDVKGRVGAEYESLILYALFTSKCMILVCSDGEYLRTDWVKNEYTRFLRMIGREEKAHDALAIAYIGAVIERLPNCDKKYQGVDMKKPDAYSLITDFVGRHSAPSSNVCKYCISCGKEDTADAKYCSECGNTEFVESREKYTEIKIRRKLEEEYAAKLDAERRARETAERALQKEIKRKEQEKTKDGVDNADDNAEDDGDSSLDGGCPNGYPTLRNYDGAAFEISGTRLEKYIGNSIEEKIPYGVTDIEAVAFYGCKSLTSIEIPNSVTSIGNSAFSGCSSLTSVTIPNSVTSIGDSTFGGCSNLSSITYMGDIKSWCEIDGLNNLMGCNINSKTLIINGKELSGRFVLLDGVASVRDSAFSGCSSLTSIKIPNSVTSIGKKAFDGCSSLTSIEIPNSVTSIGYSAFDGCSSLETIIYMGDIKSWCEIVGLSNLMYHSSSNKTLIIDGKELSGKLVIPNSVTSIGKWAFYNCSGLTSITIGNSVTSIGNSAFSGCSGLTSITIPNSVKSIGEDAFRGCSGLTSIDIPNGVTSIDNYAFYGCSGLTSITIPNSIKSIGDSAFNGCRNLKSLTIPNSVTSIGYSAFEDCRNLKSLTIPNSVTSIGVSAFYGCSGLTRINFNGTKKQWKNVRKGSLLISCKVYCVNGRVRAY